MVNPGGKVTELRAADMLLPAKCLLCGVGSYDVDKIFLDIHTDIEDYGILYLCLDCGGEIGIAAGNSPTHEFEALSLANEQLTKENEELINLVKQMGDTLENDILSYIANRNNPTTDSPSLSNSVSDEPNDEDESFLFGDSDGTTSDESDTESQAGTDDTEPTESDTSERSDDSNELTDSNIRPRQQPYVPGIEL